MIFYTNRDSHASSQSYADQLGRRSLQCSWISSLELSADGPQTSGIVMQPFQKFVGNIFFDLRDRSVV